MVAPRKATPPWNSLMGQPPVVQPVALPPMPQLPGTPAIPNAVPPTPTIRPISITVPSIQPPAPPSFPQAPMYGAPGANQTNPMQSYLSSALARSLGGQLATSLDQSLGGTTGDTQLQTDIANAQRKLYEQQNYPWLFPKPKADLTPDQTAQNAVDLENRERALRGEPPIQQANADAAAKAKREKFTNPAASYDQTTQGVEQFALDNMVNWPSISQDDAQQAFASNQDSAGTTDFWNNIKSSLQAANNGPSRAASSGMHEGTAAAAPPVAPAPDQVAAYQKDYGALSGQDISLISQAAQDQAKLGGTSVDLTDTTSGYARPQNPYRLVDGYRGGSLPRQDPSAPDVDPVAASAAAQSAATLFANNPATPPRSQSGYGDVQYSGPPTTDASVQTDAQQTQAAVDAMAPIVGQIVQGAMGSGFTRDLVQKGLSLAGKIPKVGTGPAGWAQMIEERGPKGIAAVAADITVGSLAVLGIPGVSDTAQAIVDATNPILQPVTDMFRRRMMVDDLQNKRNQAYQDEARRQGTPITQAVIDTVDRQLMSPMENRALNHGAQGVFDTSDPQTNAYLDQLYAHYQKADPTAAMVWENVGLGMLLHLVGLGEVQDAKMILDAAAQAKAPDATAPDGGPGGPAPQVHPQTKLPLTPDQQAALDKMLRDRTNPALEPGVRAELALDYGIRDPAQVDAFVRNGDTSPFTGPPAPPTTATEVRTMDNWETRRAAIVARMDGFYQQIVDAPSDVAADELRQRLRPQIDQADAEYDALFHERYDEHGNVVDGATTKTPALNPIDTTTNGATVSPDVLIHPGTGEPLTTGQQALLTRLLRDRTDLTNKSRVVAGLRQLGVNDPQAINRFLTDGDVTPFNPKTAAPVQQPPGSTLTGDPELDLQLHQQKIARLEQRIREARRRQADPATPDDQLNDISAEIRLLRDRKAALEANPPPTGGATTTTGGEAPDWWDQFQSGDTNTTTPAIRDSWDQQPLPAAPRAPQDPIKDQLDNSVGMLAQVGGVGAEPETYIYLDNQTAPQGITPDIRARLDRAGDPHGLYVENIDRQPDGTYRVTYRSGRQPYAPRLDGAIEHRPGENVSPPSTAPPGGMVRQSPEPPMPGHLRKGGGYWNVGNGVNKRMDFESDVDRALFIVQNTSKSSAHDEYMAYLRQVYPTLTDEQIKAMGTRVKSAMRSIVTQSPDERVRIPDMAEIRQPPPPEEGPPTRPEQPAGPGPWVRPATWPPIEGTRSTVESGDRFILWRPDDMGAEVFNDANKVILVTPHTVNDYELLALSAKQVGMKEYALQIMDAAYARFGEQALADSFTTDQPPAAPADQPPVTPPTPAPGQSGGPTTDEWTPHPDQGDLYGRGAEDLTPDRIKHAEDLVRSLRDGDRLVWDTGSSWTVQGNAIIDTHGTRIVVRSGRTPTSKVTGDGIDYIRYSRIERADGGGPTAAPPPVQPPTPPTQAPGPVDTSPAQPDGHTEPATPDQSPTSERTRKIAERQALIDDLNRAWADHMSKGGQIADEQWMRIGHAMLRAEDELKALLKDQADAEKLTALQPATDPGSPGPTGTDAQRANLERFAEQFIQDHPTQAPGPVDTPPPATPGGLHVPHERELPPVFMTLAEVDQNLKQQSDLADQLSAHRLERPWGDLNDPKGRAWQRKLDDLSQQLDALSKELNADRDAQTAWENKQQAKNQPSNTSPPTPTSQEGEGASTPSPSGSPSGGGAAPADESSPPGPSAGPPPQTDPGPTPPTSPTHAALQYFDALSSAIRLDVLPDTPQGLRALAQAINPAFDPKDSAAYDDLQDALEAALHQEWTQSRAADRLEQTRHGMANSLDFDMQKAEYYEKKLPRRVRSLEIADRQQFSTPLPIAEAAHYAAMVEPRDTVLEPTAGTGALITLIKDKSKVLANEIEDRRAALLQKLGFTNVTQHDAKDLPLLGVKADVVIMNPPWGKYSKGIYGPAIADGFVPGDVAERFVAQAMKSLPDKGRLVAVMPTTIADESGRAFIKWINANHTLRAMIQSPDGMYDRRGTSVGTILLVVDKGKSAEPGLDIFAFGSNAPQNLAEYTEAVGKIPKRLTAEKVATSGTNTGTGPVRSTPGGGRSARPPRPPRGTISPGPVQGGPPGVGGDGSGRGPELVPADPSVDGRTADAAGTESLVPESPPGEQQSGGEPSTESYAARMAKFANQRTRDLADARHSAVFTPYEIRSGSGHTPHPRVIVETQSLASAPYPLLKYKPGEAVQEVLRKGWISDEQHDVIAAIGQATQRGHGIMIADDVGVGKSREIAGAVLDLLQSGKAKRILITTKNADNVAGMIKEVGQLFEKGNRPAWDGDPLDFGSPEADYSSPRPAPRLGQGVGVSPRPIVPAGPRDLSPRPSNAVGDTRIGADVAGPPDQSPRPETPAGPVGVSPRPEGALGDDARLAAAQAAPDFSSISPRVPRPALVIPDYPIIDITDYPATKKHGIGHEDSVPVLDTGVYLMDSANFAPYIEALKAMGFDAWMADEANVYKNIEGANRGIAWKELHAKLMDRQAPIHYFTATPATTPEDLEYLYNLGEWSTADGHFQNFLGRVTGVNSTTAATAQGPGQLSAGNQAQMGVTQGAPGGRGAGAARSSAFDTSMNPAEMEQLTRELKSKGKYIARDLWRGGVEFAINEIPVPPLKRAELDTAVMLLRDTEEQSVLYARQDQQHRAPFGVRAWMQAEMKRRLFDARIDGVTQATHDALARGEQVVIFTNSVSPQGADRGNLSSMIGHINTYAIDDLGNGNFSNPYLIPEAVETIGKLQDRLAALPELRDPIAHWEAEFGEGNVSKIIGKVSTKQRQAFIQDFQMGKRRVAIISEAGTTGINLHQEYPGTGRRRLIMADFNWAADVFKQIMGRIDRTGQLSSPSIDFFHMGQAAERKFVSTIANRLQGLGALSKGQAGSVGATSLNTFELESGMGREAVRRTWSSMDISDRQWFTGSEYAGFHQANIPGAGAAPKNFLLELQFMPLAIANRLAEEFVSNYEDVTGEAANSNQAARQSLRGVGEITRSTPIQRDLTLHEVKDELGGRAGIVSGNLMIPDSDPGRMGKITGALRDASTQGAVQRQYTTFTDKASGRRVSGIRIPPGKIEDVGRALGLNIKEKVRTVRSVVSDLSAGDKIDLYGLNGDNYVLRQRQDGQIAVDGAKRGDARALVAEGAVYSMVGSYFHVPPENLARFIKRFPFKNAGKEQVGADRNILTSPTGLARLSAIAPGAAMAVSPQGQNESDETYRERQALAASLIAMGMLGKDDSLVGEGKPFYSSLTKTLLEKMPNKASVEQIRGILGLKRDALGRLTTSAVKVGEVVWTGLDDQLDSWKQAGVTPTKDLVRQYLDSHGVEVHEIVRGAGTEGWKAQGPSPWMVTDAQGNAVGYYGGVDEADALRNAAAKNHERNTKYRQYTEPGAHSGTYRELLLTVPPQTTARVVPHPNHPGYYAVRTDGVNYVRNGPETVAPGDVTRWDTEELAQRYGIPFHDHTDFTSSHWDGTPNIVAHVRFEERTDAQGRKVLHLDEIQSDWGQQGRSEGFQLSPDAARQNFLQYQQARNDFDAADAAFNEAVTAHNSEAPQLNARLKEIRTAHDANKPRFTLVDRNHQVVYQGNDLGRVSDMMQKNPLLNLDPMGGVTRYPDEFFTHQQRLQDLYRPVQDHLEARTVAQRRMRELGAAANDYKTPNGPFVEKSDEWASLAMKRMVRWAVDRGYDRITWSEGDVHTRRWGSSEIAWTTQPAQTYHSAYDEFGDSGEPERFASREDVPEGYDYLGPNTEPEHFLVGGRSQVGGNAAGMNLEAEAQARGLLGQVDNTVVRTERELHEALDAGDMVDPPGRAEVVEKRTTADKLWQRMQANPSGVYRPRAEGFQYFYDVMLPKIAQQLGKKFGAVVGKTTLLDPTFSPHERWTVMPRDGGYRLLDRQTNTWGDRLFPTEARALDYVEENNPSGSTRTAHSLDITPEMRKSVQGEGFALYAGVPPDVAAKSAIAWGKLGYRFGKYEAQAIKEHPHRTAFLLGAGGLTAVAAWQRNQREAANGPEVVSDNPTLQTIATFKAYGLEPRDVMDGLGIYNENVVDPLAEAAFEVLDLFPAGMAALTGSRPSAARRGFWTNNTPLQFAGDLVPGNSQGVVDWFDKLKARAKERQQAAPAVYFVAQLPFDPLNWFGWGSHVNGRRVEGALNSVEALDAGMTAGEQAVGHSVVHLSAGAVRDRTAEEMGQRFHRVAGTNFLSPDVVVDDIDHAMHNGTATEDQVKLAHVMGKKNEVDAAAVRDLARKLGSPDRIPEVAPELVQAVAERVARTTGGKWSPEDIDWLRSTFNAAGPTTQAMVRATEGWLRAQGFLSTNDYLVPEAGHLTREAVGDLARIVGAPPGMGVDEHILRQVQGAIRVSQKKGGGWSETMVEQLRSILGARQTVVKNPNLYQLNVWATRYGLPDLSEALRRGEKAQFGEFEKWVMDQTRRSFPEQPSAATELMQAHPWASSVIRAFDQFTPVADAVKGFKRAVTTPLTLMYLATPAWPIHAARELGLRAFHPDVLRQTGESWGAAWKLARTGEATFADVRKTLAWWNDPSLGPDVFGAYYYPSDLYGRHGLSQLGGGRNAISQSVVPLVGNRAGLMAGNALRSFGDDLPSTALRKKLLDLGARGLADANVGKVYDIAQDMIGKMDAKARQLYIAREHPKVYQEVLAQMSKKDRSIVEAQTAVMNALRRPTGVSDTVWNQVAPLVQMAGHRGMMATMVEGLARGTIDRNALARHLLSTYGTKLPYFAHSEIWALVTHATPEELTAYFAKGGAIESLVQDALELEHGDRVGGMVRDAIKNSDLQTAAGQRDAWKQVKTGLDAGMQVSRDLWDWAWQMKDSLPRHEQDLLFTKVRELRQNLITAEKEDAMRARDLFWHEVYQRPGGNVPFPEALRGQIEESWNARRQAFVETDNRWAKYWKDVTTNGQHDSQVLAALRDANTKTWNGYRSQRLLEEQDIHERLMQFYAEYAKSGKAVDSYELVYPALAKVVPPQAVQDAKDAIDAVREQLQRFTTKPSMNPDQARILRDWAQQGDAAVQALPAEMTDKIQKAHEATARLVREEGNKRFVDYTNRTNLDEFMQAFLPFWQYDYQGGNFYKWVMTHVPGAPTTTARYMQQSQGTGYLDTTGMPGGQVLGSAVSPIRGLWASRIVTFANQVASYRPQSLKDTLSQFLDQGVVGAHITPGVSIPIDLALGKNLTQVDWPSLAQIADDARAMTGAGLIRDNQFSQYKVNQELAQDRVDLNKATPDQLRQAQQQFAQHDLPEQILPLFNYKTPDQIQYRPDFQTEMKNLGYSKVDQQKWLNQHPNSSLWGMLDNEQKRGMFDRHPGWAYILQASEAFDPPDVKAKKVAVGNAIETLQRITADRLAQENTLDARLNNPDPAKAISTTEWIRQHSILNEQTFGARSAFDKSDAAKLLQDEQVGKILAPQDQAKLQYYANRAQWATESTDPDTGQTDWAAVEAKTKQYLASLPPAMAQYVETEAEKNWSPTEKRYHLALNQLGQFDALPKYLGVTPDEAAKRAKLDHTYAVLQNRDARAAVVYYALPQNALLRKRLKTNPARVQFLLQNAEFRYFFGHPTKKELQQLARPGSNYPDLGALTDVPWRLTEPGGAQPPDGSGLGPALGAVPPPGASSFAPTAP